MGPYIRHYKLIGQTPVPADGKAGPFGFDKEALLDYARWFETAERRVKLTRVGPYFVSTVFLGLNHQFDFSDPRPVLFETMIWIELKQYCEFLKKELDGTFLDLQRRCSTWLEAEAQHQEVIDEMREASDDIEQLYPVPAEQVIAAEAVGKCGKEKP